MPASMELGREQWQLLHEEYEGALERRSNVLTKI